MPKQMPNRKRLSDLAVARMGPGPIIWDILLPRFGVRPGTRVKTWIVNLDGDKHKVGHYPALGVAEARAKAREIMEGGLSRETADSPFGGIVEQFLAHGRTRKGRELRANTVNQYRRVFNRYCKPLSNVPIGNIGRRDIAELLRDVAHESGAPTASLLRSMLARLWSYGIETGVVEHNVVTGTPSYEVPKRSRVLTDAEIAAIWNITGLLSSDFGLILKLLFWTGTRRSEVGGARWSEMSRTENQYEVIWTIPGSRTKNHRELVLPLPRQAVADIGHWPRVVGKDTLFGMNSPRGFTPWSAAKRRLDKQLGFDRDWDLHDIRRTVQTRLRAIGVNHEIVNRILNHAFDPVTEAYDRHHYTTEKRTALQLWADELDRIVTEAKPAVIRMRRSQ